MVSTSCLHTDLTRFQISIQLHKHVELMDQEMKE